MPEAVEIFDTTLRDGAQFEGISLTVEDKLRVAEQLDWLGVHWIEGGYPQANPKDEEFFRRAPSELSLSSAELVAFGSTRRPAGKVDVDPTLAALVGAGTGTVCIVGKSWDFHVTEALRTTLDEGVAMVGESVAFLAGEGLRVFFDAEHFFDGYKANPEFALRVLEAAAENGAAVVVLCDTNGGSLAHEVQQMTTEVTTHFGDDVAVGIHTQNDSGSAVANSVAAVLGGATPGAGHDQRVRGAHGQRQPHDRHPRPHPQARRGHAARGPDGPPHGGQPPGGRTGQPAASALGPLRGDVCVRPQGRAAHLGARTGGGRHLRARRPGRGREPHPRPRVRSRRARRHGHEGHRVRPRARRPGRRLR